MFSSMAKRFDGLRGKNDFVPSFLTRPAPSTETVPFFRLTALTFPTSPLNSPLATFMLSPSLNETVLVPYFLVRSSASGAARKDFLMCRGEFILNFLCFDAFLLDLHDTEK